MARRNPPTAVGSNAGLGLAFPERDYLAFDPFDGERDTGRIRCLTTKLCKARDRLTCYGLQGEQDHSILAGETYRVQSGVVGGRWGSYRLCIKCMDKWLTEIGRPRSASPNVRGAAAPRA